MKCYPTYVSVSPQALLFQPIIFCPHAPFSYPNSEWLYTPLTPRTSARAIINDQISLDTAQSGLPPLTCFRIYNRTTRCHPRPTPILNDYILASHPRTSAGAINDQISLDTAQSGLPSIPSLILNHTFTTSAIITPC